jgi:hypothetical protein
MSRNSPVAEILFAHPAQLRKSRCAYDIFRRSFLAEGADAEPMVGEFGALKCHLVMRDDQ